MELGAIDRLVDVLHSGCWDKCLKSLTQDLIVSGSGKCLKSWGKVKQALERALLEQETWKATRSCLKITPKVGVAAATQTTFGDRTGSNTNNRSWLVSY